MKRCLKHQKKWGEPKGACDTAATPAFRAWLRDEFASRGLLDRCWLKAGRDAPCVIYFASDGQRRTLDRWFHHSFKGRFLRSDVPGTLGVMGDMWHLAHTDHFIQSTRASTLAGHVLIARKWANLTRAEGEDGQGTDAVEEERI
jgi:hypothetical protein